MRATRRQLMQSSAVTLALGALTGFDHQASLARQTATSIPEQSVNAALLEFASCIPLSLLAENATNGFELLTFGDFRFRQESVGVDIAAISDPVERVSEFYRSVQPVPAADLMMAVGRADNSVALLGWTQEQVEQSAYVMSSEGVLTVLRGAFDEATLRQNWVDQGYQANTVEGVSVASLAEDGAMDISTDLGRFTLGKAANVALLDSGLLLYAPTLAGLTAMIQAHNGSENSLGTDALVRTVVDALPDRVSGASLFPPGAFVTPVEISTGENGPEFGDMPEAGPIPLMGLVGFVSGPAVPDSDMTATTESAVPSGSTFVASRHFLSGEEAEWAARRSFVTLETGASLRTGQPWSEVFPSWQISVDRDSDTVLTEIELYGNEAIWVQLFLSRDASFLYG